MFRKLLVAAALALPACAPITAAHVSAPSDSAAPTSSVPKLDLATQHLLFPALRGDAELPSADDAAMHMQHILGQSASADVRVCVDATGRVKTAALRRSSGLASYDAGVVADVKKWSFEAPTSAECTDLTVIYTLR